jgi:trimeric autotransporter adhesin
MYVSNDLLSVKTLPVRNSFSRSPLRRAFLAGALGLAWLALSFPAQAVLPSPTPDGGYPGDNTAEGTRALFNRTTGINNTATGFEALFSNTTGSWNTANGWSALHDNNGDSNTAIGNNALHDNQIGTANTATGTGALRLNKIGINNTANGFQALISNQTGSFNTATGFQALWKNNEDSNTATGHNALHENQTGKENTATGTGALRENVNGIDNTANGFQALFFNTSGSFNTAVGFHALFNNTTISGLSGDDNTATGFNALFSNSTGFQNTASGSGALQVLQGGADNVAVGYHALFAGTVHNNNTAVGSEALANNSFNGAENTALGFRAGSGVTSASGVICIGAFVGGENLNDTCYIGNIINNTSPGGVAVFVNENNKLGTITSSRRFKEAIKPMERASEALFALKPVTFRYKKEVDPASKPQFGLVAEDVEAVNPDLVVRDKEGKPYSVRYDQVNAMLLNEFLKEHRKVEEQQAMIAELKSTVAQQRQEFQAVAAQLKEQAVQIQEVSAQIELSKPAPQTVASQQ